MLQRLQILVPEKLFHVIDVGAAPDAININKKKNGGVTLIR